MKWSRHAPWLWLIGALAVAIAARVWHIGSWDLWTDELNTMTIAQSGEFTFGPSYRTAPINFVLTGWVIRLLGYTPLAGRLVPLVAGVLAVGATWIVARKWINDRAAVLAALIVALSSWHVYWSQTARHFALAGLFVLVALHCFLLYWREGRISGLVGMSASFLLAMFTHSSSGFYVVTLGVFVCVVYLAQHSGVWKGERVVSPRRFRWSLAVLVATFMVYLPNYVKVGSYVLSNTPPWNSTLNIIGSFAFYLPAWLVFLAIAGLAVCLKDRDDLGLMLFLCILLPAALVLLAAGQTTASASYCLASLFAIALLAGLGLDRIGTLGKRGANRSFGLIAALGVFASLSWDLALYHSYYNGYKPRWRDVALFVAAERARDDVVVASEADVVGYYLPQDSVAWLDRYAASFGALGSPPRDRDLWIAAYAGEQGPLGMSDTGRQFLRDQAEMKAFFPMHYGPKDRTIAVYLLKRSQDTVVAVWSRE